MNENRLFMNVYKVNNLFCFHSIPCSIEVSSLILNFALLSPKRYNRFLSSCY